jgi:outer membrane receptor protein involved in Fe transport
VGDPCGKITDTETYQRCLEIGGVLPGQTQGNGDDNSQEKSTVGGNPNLKPEKADIYTLGVVYQPRWVPGASLTVDYYNIAIRKAIGAIGAQTILAGCMAGNDAYCNLVERDESGHILDITDLNQNVGKEASAGIDVAARYDLRTPRFGRFGFEGVVTWLQKHDQTLANGDVIHGKGTFDLQLASGGGAGGTNPEWKGNLGVNWGLGDLGAGASMKYIGSFKECGESSGNFGGGGLCYVDDTYSRQVKQYMAFDLYATYKLTTIAGKTSIMVGVNNVFDKAPPFIYNGFANNTDTYAYDQIGRYYYVRLSHSL